jgi:outer membrane biosynthesis protein TonB
MKTLKISLFLLMLTCISSYTVFCQSTTNTEQKTKYVSPVVSESKVLPTQVEITADSIAATDSFQVADVAPKILKRGNFENIKNSIKNENCEGAITVKMLVNRQGNVMKVIVTKVDSGIQVIEEGMIKGMMNCKFEPAKQNGKPIPSWTSISLYFKSAPRDSTVKKDNGTKK